MSDRSIVKTSAVDVIRHIGIIIMFFGILMLAAFTSITTAQAQQSKAKPKLIPIVLNKETSDQKALDIAKKLDPEFFNVDMEFVYNADEAAHYARFLPLNSKNPRKFIVVTATHDGYLCTAFGCPYYIYENTKGSQWRTVLHWQAHSFWYDQNSPDTHPRNLISSTIEKGREKVNVWMWSINKYAKVK